MAKPNYSFEKRQRELAKKKKKEEKSRKKLHARLRACRRLPMNRMTMAMRLLSLRSLLEGSAWLSLQPVT